MAAEAAEAATTLIQRLPPVISRALMAETADLILLLQAEVAAEPAGQPAVVVLVGPQTALEVQLALTLPILAAPVMAQEMPAAQVTGLLITTVVVVAAQAAQAETLAALLALAALAQLQHLSPQPKPQLIQSAK